MVKSTTDQSAKATKASKVVEAKVSKKASEQAAKKEKDKETIKKAFGRERADLTIKYCLEHNLNCRDDEVKELAFVNQDEWVCYLCCSKDVEATSERCCSRFACEKHMVFDRVCFINSLKCGRCRNWCAEGHVVCKDCFDEEEEVLEYCWESWVSKEVKDKYFSLASEYLKGTKKG